MDGQVQLVDARGIGLGHCAVDEAHRAPGRRHRAFSVVLHDGAGSVLFQTRSPDKERWPGYLANSCCGHPDSEVSLLDDCRRRVSEELGIEVTVLVEIGRFEYQAAMPGSSWVEWEYDHVVVGRVARDVVPVFDPAEVSDLRWISAFEPWDLADPAAPWLAEVLREALPHLPDFTRDG